MIACLPACLSVYLSSNACDRPGRFDLVAAPPPPDAGGGSRASTRQNHGKSRATANKAVPVYAQDQEEDGGDGFEGDFKGNEWEEGEVERGMLHALAELGHLEMLLHQVLLCC